MVVTDDEKENDDLIGITNPYTVPLKSEDPPREKDGLPKWWVKWRTERQAHR